MEQNRKRQDRKSGAQRITEEQIQKKLYGETAPSPEPDSKPQSLISEQDIKSRLYGIHQDKPAVEPPEREIPEPVSPVPVSLPRSVPDSDSLPSGGDLFVSKGGAETKVRQEITDLKEAIATLEQKLSTAEQTKERLIKQLGRKQTIDTARTVAMSQILTAVTQHSNKILVGVCALLLVLLFIRPHAEPVQKPVVPPPVHRPAVAEKKAAVVEKTAPAASVPEMPSLPAEAPSESAAEAVSAVEKSYTLQVAEYANKEAADRFVESLTNLGFEVFIQSSYRNNGKAYFKINVGSFPSYADAKRFIDVFTEKTGVKDAFVKEKKD